MTDIDQHYKYSFVVALKKTGSNIAINSIYPNPFINEIQVSINLDKEQNIRLNLLNYEGKLIIWKEKKCKPRNNTFLFNSPENLIRGIYILQFITEEGIINEKLVKVN